MEKRYKILITIITLCILGIVGSIAYRQFYLTPQLRAARENLQIESYRINSFPGSKLIDCSLHNTMKRVSINRTYSTDQTWNEVYEFYLNEAKRNGWILLLDGTVVSGKESKAVLTFHKDDYNLSVEGNTPADSHTFKVNLFWTGSRNMRRFFLNQ